MNSPLNKDLTFDLLSKAAGMWFKYGPTAMNVMDSMKGLFTLQNMQKQELHEQIKQNGGGLYILLS